jgi:ribosomal protein S12 methylthiotransferase accessory factor
VRLDRAGVTAPEARARELFHALVGRRTGIIRQIDLVPTVSGDADLVHAGAQIANAHPYHGPHLGLGVGGCGQSRAEAVIAALCEGVERYAASSYGPAPRGLVSRRELAGAPSIDPRALVAFTDAQRSDPDFPLEPVTDETPLRWVQGRELATGEAVLVPAFATYLPYMLERDEPLVAMGLSTGLACGPTLEDAACKGICEAIERDAMALTWVRGIAPPRVPVELVTECVGHLLPPGDDVAAYDLTSDLEIPVFMVIAQGQGPRGRLVAVGAAAHPDAGVALRKAAMEASQDRAYVRMLVDRGPTWTPDADFGNVSDFSLHARLYSSSAALARKGLAFLTGNPATGGDRLETSGEMTLENLVGALARRGMSGALVDLTPPWAARLGLEVARVVVPDLVPLHGDHRLRYLGHPRLARWKTSMPHGVVAHDRPLWPYPHPMP